MNRHGTCVAMIAIGAMAAQLPAQTSASSPATASFPSLAAASAPTTSTAPGLPAANIDVNFYKPMADVCKFDAKQRARLDEAIAAVNKADEEYRLQLQRLSELRHELQQAIKDQDKPGIERLQAQIDELVGAPHEVRMRLRAQRIAGIVSIPTRDQRIAWEDYMLRDILREHYWKMEFSPEQAKKADDLYRQAATKVADLTNAFDNRSRDEIMMDLAKRIDEQVLTPRQRAKQ